MRGRGVLLLRFILLTVILGLFSACDGGFESGIQNQDELSSHDLEIGEQRFSNLMQAMSLIDVSIVPTGSFLGFYYDDTVATHSRFVDSRNDAKIDFYWSGSPMEGVPADNFSVYWVGRFDMTSGIYRFTATADDGIRVLVDGIPVIDVYKNQSATTYTSDVSLAAGTHLIQVLYYEGAVTATAKVSFAELAPEPPPPLVTMTGEKRLIFQHSKKCAGVKSSSQADLAPVIQWDCVTVNDQIFDFRPQADGSHEIVAKHSGKCLAINGTSTDDGVELVQMTCQDVAQQRFRLNKINDHFQIIAAHSNRCLSIAGASTSNNIQLTQATCSSSATSQIFALDLDIPTSNPNPTPDTDPMPNLPPASGAPLSPKSGAISIASHGAKNDPNADNRAAIQNAINAAASKKTDVYIPPGRYGYKGVLNVNGVRIIGAGSNSELRALDGLNEAIILTGSGPVLANVKLTTTWTGGRQSKTSTQRVVVNNATNFIIDRIQIERSAAGGIMMMRSSHGRVSNNSVYDTLADSIHMTHGSNNILVENNRIDKSGDDGVAVVSYGGASAPIVHHITARNNIVRNNKHGRGMTVVGGADVLYENNLIEEQLGACFYIASEGSYDTAGVRNVMVRNNTVKNCGLKRNGHSGLFAYSSNGLWVENVTFQRNLVIQPADLPGARLVGNLIRNLTFDSNKIEGTTKNTYGTAGQVIKNVPYTSGSVGYKAP